MENIITEKIYEKFNLENYSWWQSLLRSIHHGSIGSTHRAGYNKFIKERGTKPFRSKEEQK